MLEKCKITVERFGEVKSPPGPLYLDVLNQAGLDLHNYCGGHGKCGRCLLRFISPAPEPLKSDRHHLDEAQLADGLRLACFHQVRKDSHVEIPDPPEIDLLDSLTEGLLDDLG